MQQSFIPGRTSLCLFLILVFSKSFSQQKDTSVYYAIDQTKELSLLVGANVGKYVNAEIGLGINRFGRVGPHPSGVCYYFANEIKTGDKFLLGPKIGIHFSGGMAFGFSLIYYTDFDSSTVVFRPDIGIGFQRFKMAYGYNFKISNKHLSEISTHLFTVIYLFRLKHLKDIRR